MLPHIWMFAQKYMLECFHLLGTNGTVVSHSVEQVVAVTGIG